MPHGRGGSWIWPPTRWAIYYRDSFTCQHCGVKVTPGVHPRETSRKNGWTPKLTNGTFVDKLVDDTHVACIDHPRKGCPVEECVTSCFPCNSSGKDKDRSAYVKAAPLTKEHRAMGRELYLKTQEKA